MPAVQQTGATATALLRYGGTQVSVSTDMPGVTPTKWAWWLGWHGSDSRRYRLQHPRARLAADGAAGRRADQLDVLGQHAGGVARRGRLETRLARLEFGRIHPHVHRALGHVEADTVAVLQERYGSPVDGLGSDVPDAQAGGAAGEPAVGHQQHVLAEPGAFDGAGDRQHLPHPWTALGPFVADH